ncbi:MAG: GNAT family N-acetyltransferase, partial [Acidobacteriota bacterium]|nr:GNAT family N-acetyltransferase [Acidobacteriota bacterium]
MPSIKPLKKLVKKARDLHAGHRLRHSPTGFGFALADSVDYLDGARWDTLTADASIFLSRRYLRVLEEAGPENLRQRYALIFRGQEAVAAVAAQCVTLSVARARKTTRHQKVTAPLEHLEEKMLVCGNLLSWGMHGIAFARGEDTTELWPAVAEALYRLRRADRLLGNTDLVMIKDITAEHAEGAAGLAKFSYRSLETDPNMILEISPKWHSFEDYLASLTSKYRKTARQIDKDVTAAGCVVEDLIDVER